MTAIANLVHLYRRFYAAADPFDMRQAALPVITAFEVLRTADRRLFPGRDGLAEAIAGAVLQTVREDAGHNAQIAAQLLEFANEFLGLLPAQAVKDAGFITERFARLIADACAAIYIGLEREAQSGEPRQSVSQFASAHGVSREYVLAEIRDGALNAEMIGSRYALLDSRNREWIDNPQRGSRSKKGK